MIFQLSNFRYIIMRLIKFRNEFPLFFLNNKKCGYSSDNSSCRESVQFTYHTKLKETFYNNKKIIYLQEIQKSITNRDILSNSHNVTNW